MTEAPTYQKGRKHAFIKAGDRLGAHLERLGIERSWTDLFEERLLQEAMSSAGLDDFGSDIFHEPLRMLLGAARTEGRLTWTGRKFARLAVKNGLVVRLRTQEAVRRNADILEQPVRRPLIVTGPPRTGTTLMNHLLALDPAARPLLIWESLDPTPWRFRRYAGGDPRRALSALKVRLTKTCFPGLAVAHDFSPRIPDECQYLFWPTFVWPPAMVLPSYRAWLMRQPPAVYDKVYGEYRRALQMLHWQRPARGHWVLKSPLHSWALPSLMKVVPEASVIQMHRNLIEVLPSLCSLGAILASVYTDSVEPRKVGPLAMDLARDAVGRILDFRTQVEESRLCEVAYTRFIADPVGTVRGIYDAFGYDFTPEFEVRMRRFLAGKASSRCRPQVYSLEQFDLDGAVISQTFADYHRLYGIDGP